MVRPFWVNKMNRLEVGKIVNTHGLRGEVKIVPWCDAPELFETFSVLFLGDTAYPLKQVKYQKANVIVKLQGVDTIEQAEKLKNRVVSVSREELEANLEEGRYFIADLIGLEVYWEERCLGKLTEVLQTGANDVYIVTDENGKELLLPAIRQVILEIDVPGGRMLVQPLEGMMEL